MSEKIALAVDLGGTNLRVAAVSEDGTIIVRESEPTRHDGDTGDVVTDQIIKLLQKIRAQFSDQEIVGIGIGAPGAIDKKNGGIWASNVSEHFVPIVGPVSNEFGLPVYFLNDASVATLGEQKYGAARDVQNFVYVTISTGIGSGAVVDGHLLGGENNNAGEVGHFAFENKYAIPCHINLRYGNWDGYASGKNIPRFFAAWGEKMGYTKEQVSVQTTPELFSRVSSGDGIAQEFMEELGRVNAMGITNVIMAYDPQRIVLGGSVSVHHGEVLIKYFKPLVDGFLEIPEIVISTLGDNNVLVGAAAMVFEN